IRNAHSGCATQGIVVTGTGHDKLQNTVNDRSANNTDQPSITFERLVNEISRKGKNHSGNSGNDCHDVVTLAVMVLPVTFIQIFQRYFAFFQNPEISQHDS